MKQHARLPGVLLCSIVVVGTAVPRPAIAHAPAARAEGRKQLDVQVEAQLGEADEDKLAATVREAVVSRLRAREVEITDDAKATLRVTIGWHGRSRSDLELRWILRDGATPPKTLLTSVCAACGSSEVAAAVDGDLAPLWAKIDAAAATVTTPRPIVEIPGPHVPPPRVTADESTPDGRRTIGMLGIAGVAVSVVGVGAVSAGAVMWRVQYRYPPDEPTIRQNLEQPGIAMVAAGGALAIAGVVMAVVDLSRGRRSKSVSVSPTAGRHHVGAALAVRW